MKKRTVFSIFLSLMLFSSHGAQAGTPPQVATVTWGPITVSAMGSSHNLFLYNQTKPCTDCYITAMKMDLVDANQNTINYSTGGMLHHAVVSNATATDKTCAGTLLGTILGERFFASGNERTTADIASGYGYYVGVNDSWTVVADIMNMTMQQKDFYLEFTVTYEEGDPPLTAVKPIWFDVDYATDNCNDSEISLPSGYSDSHWNWTADDDYTIVGGAGHTHDGGISVSLEDVTHGEYLCTSVAGYVENSAYAPAPVPPGSYGHPDSANEISVLDSDPAYEEHIEDHSLCPVADVHMGDTLRVHAQYNLSAPDPGAMGIMLIYAAPL